MALNILQALADAATTLPDARPWWAKPEQYVLPVAVGLMLLWLLNSGKSKRNESKKHEEMLKNLKRGDRVKTIGGIFGTVVDVRDADVVLKVDESANTKIKFARSAVSRVVNDDDVPAK